MDHQKTTLGQGVDHLVKEAPFSAHMSGMSTVKRTLAAAALAAVFLTLATGCSDGVNPVGAVVTDEEREAYEAARFLTPEGKAAADREVARINAGIRPGNPAVPNGSDALLRPADWPELAQGKLCEYTATLIGNADRDGTVVPEKARTAANRILERC